MRIPKDTIEIQLVCFNCGKPLSAPRKKVDPRTGKLTMRVMHCYSCQNFSKARGYNKGIDDAKEAVEVVKKVMKDDMKRNEERINRYGPIV